MIDTERYDAGLPAALFQVGDHGVSNEWRDFSLDWMPLIGPTGFALYSVLRDHFAHQRALFPGLIDGEGPSKRELHGRLGLQSGYTLEGPEYLLEALGLLSIELVRGGQPDPEQPSTSVRAIYSLGTRRQPRLEWPVLDRLLDALQPALAARPSDLAALATWRRATAALRTLKQDGLFALHYRFHPLGTWPRLLPTLIADERWLRLFRQLHRIDDRREPILSGYCQQVRAWGEGAQRQYERLQTKSTATMQRTLAAIRGESVHAIPQTVPPGTPSALPDGLQKFQPPAVPGVSRACPQGLQTSQPPSGTWCLAPHHSALAPLSLPVPAMSLSRDQLMMNESISRDVDPGTLGDINRELPLPIACQLREHECCCVEYGGYFWEQVHQILRGTAGRYPHTDAEKKAVTRRYRQGHSVPIAVPLAALRAVVAALPDAERPATLHAALRLPAFAAAEVQALQLVARQSTADGETDRPDPPQWTRFIERWRALGGRDQLRNVQPEEYHRLQSLFAADPDGCWQVLDRVGRMAQPPTLTAAYVQRALMNNRAAGETPETTAVQRSANIARPAPLLDDPRRSLLQEYGVRLTAAELEPLSLDLIQAWIAACSALPRPPHNPGGWLAKGLRSQQPPPVLYTGAGSQHALPSGSIACREPEVRLDATEPSRPAASQTWSQVRDQLAQALPPADFETWISALSLEDAGEVVVIGTPNIFVRDEVNRTYLPYLRTALTAVLGRAAAAIEVEVVIRSV